jgi:peptidoglycan/LPS O-acetylase OafA/YrhL
MVQQSEVQIRDGKSRFVMLDLIRIIAALWVAIYHLTGGHGWHSSLKHPYGNILLEGELGPFSSLVRLGFLGVPIFFVISGFVIVQSSKDKSPRAFFVSRFSRLAPGFIFAILLTVSFQSYGYGAERSITLTNLASTLGLVWSATQTNPIQASFWTLWPEIRFYGLFLIFVLLFYRKVTFGRKTAIFFMAWLISLWFFDQNQGVLSSLLITDYACYFILGGLLALSQDSKKFWGLFPFILGANVIVFLNLRAWIFSWDGEHPNDWRMGLIIFFSCILLIGFSGKLNVKSKMIVKILFSLGRASYVIYLLQEGVGMPITSYFVTKGLQIRYAIPMSLFIVISVSLLFTIFLERRLINRTKQYLDSGLTSALR